MAEGDQAEVRALAAEIAKPPYPFDPATMRKGVVVSVESGTSPPTVTVTLSGDTTNIAGVQYVRSYYPVVADTVLILKQGSELVIVDAITTTYKADYDRAATDAGDGLAWADNTFSVKAATNGGIASESAGVRVSAGSGIIVDSGGTRVDAHNGITVDGNGVSISTSAAGAGLTYSSGVLAVGQGTGISVSADAVAVNRAAHARTVGIDYGGVSDTGDFQTCDHPTDLGLAFGTIDNNFYITALCINDIINKLQSAGIML